MARVVIGKSSEAQIRGLWRQPIYVIHVERDQTNHLLFAEDPLGEHFDRRRRPYHCASVERHVIDAGRKAKRRFNRREPPAS